MSKLGDTIVIHCKNCGKRHEFVVTAQGTAGTKYCSENCRKRYYDKSNEWKRKDNCPSCGGIKYKRSKTCWDCRRTNIY